MKRMRCAGAVLAWAGLIALVGCGGGGGGSPDDPQVPMAVTATVPATGGQVRLPLADGGEALLLFPAQAFGVDTPVTVRALPAGAGEWARLRIEPAVAGLGATPTLRMRPPRSVAATQVPVLQWLGADGAVRLATRRRADDRIEAALPTQLAGAAPATAAAGRMRAQAAARPQADREDDATTVAGTGFLAVCQAPQSAIADALRVIENGSGGGAVLSALSTLAMLSDRCAGPGVLDEAQADTVRRLLEDLAAGLPGRYRTALAAWQAVDYGWVERQTEAFGRGVRRLLALCRAAGDLGAVLTCPVPADYDPEYTELANGFAAASGEREHQGSLRLLLDQVLPLPAEAALFGLREAEPALRATVGLIADRLMDRAYALCSHGELFEWRAWADGGAPTSRSAATLAQAMALCGVQATARRVSVDSSGAEQLGEPQTFEPGTLDGTGRLAARTLTVPFDGRVLVTATGPALRCSRVIGTQLRDESLELRIGAEVVGFLALTGAGDDPAPSEARLDVASLLAQIGRAEGSTDPVVVEVWRPAAGPLACADSGGGTLEVLAEAQRLYTLTLQPPLNTLRVRVFAPPAVATEVVVAVDVHARQSDGSWLPQTGALVELRATGGTVRTSPAYPSTNQVGRMLFSVQPVAGHASVELVARTTVDGVAGSGGASLRVGAVRWTGSFEYASLGQAASPLEFDPDVAESSERWIVMNHEVPRGDVALVGNPWEAGGMRFASDRFPATSWGYDRDATTQYIAARTEDCRVIRSEQRWTNYVVDPPTLVDGLLANPLLQIATVIPIPDAAGRFAYRVEAGQYLGQVSYERVDTNLRSPEAGSHCTSESALRDPFVVYREGPLQQAVNPVRKTPDAPPDVSPVMRFTLPEQRADAEIVIDLDAPFVVIDNAEWRGVITRRVLLRLRPELP
jgi:hypothetical protein